MLCSRPYMLGTLPCPCGGCLCCRINRRRVWAHRILLESFKHGDSSFVTLTYNDENVPDELVKAHYQNWLKRLRRSLSPRKIRFFLAGEYGELTGRPHFHAALFGVDAYTLGGVDGRGELLARSWPFGFTLAGSLTWESAQYIAGYLTKKVVGDERSVREFSRMSLRPGIGAGAMRDVARGLSCDAGLDQVVSDGDVPAVLSHGRRLLPLGRYLRRRLRGELGFVDKNTPVGFSRLCSLRSSVEASEARRSLKEAGLKSWEAQKLILDMRKQKCINLVSRFKSRDSKRSLK